MRRGSGTTRRDAYADDEDGTVIMARNTDRRRIEIELESRLSALQSVQTELEHSQEESAALKARVAELEEALERPASPDAEAGAAPAHPVSDDQAQGLAVRVAELEARLARAVESGETDTAPVSEQLRETQERAQILEAQLEAARVREDELVGHTVRADATVADVGARLAESGTAADRVEGLEAELAEARSRLETVTESEASARAEIDRLSLPSRTSSSGSPRWRRSRRRSPSRSSSGTAPGASSLD